MKRSKINIPNLNERPNIHRIPSSDTRGTVSSQAQMTGPESYHRLESQTEHWGNSFPSSRNANMQNLSQQSLSQGLSQSYLTSQQVFSQSSQDDNLLNERNMFGRLSDFGQARCASPLSNAYTSQPPLIQRQLKNSFIKPSIGGSYFSNKLMDQHLRELDKCKVSKEMESQVEELKFKVNEMKDLLGTIHSDILNLKSTIEASNINREVAENGFKEKLDEQSKLFDEIANDGCCIQSRFDQLMNSFPQILGVESNQLRNDIKREIQVLIDQILKTQKDSHYHPSNESENIRNSFPPLLPTHYCASYEFKKDPFPKLKPVKKLSRRHSQKRIAESNGLGSSFYHHDIVLEESVKTQNLKTKRDRRKTRYYGHHEDQDYYHHKNCEFLPSKTEVEKRKMEKYVPSSQTTAADNMSSTGGEDEEESKDDSFALKQLKWDDALKQEENSDTVVECSVPVTVGDIYSVNEDEEEAKHARNLLIQARRKRMRKLKK